MNKNDKKRMKDKRNRYQLNYIYRYLPYYQEIAQNQRLCGSGSER